MRNFEKMFLFFILAIAATTIWPSTVNAQQQKIEGEVLTKTNDPIPSVLVRIYRGSIKVGEATTGPDGKYSISFDRGDPVTLIRYDCTSWDPATIDDVSGRRNHSINKVMYPVGSKLSVNQAIPVLFALQRIYYVDRANNVPVNESAERYAIAMETARFPDRVKSHLGLVRGLYGLDPS